MATKRVRTKSKSTSQHDDDEVRRPDYTMTAYETGTGARTTIGAGWIRRNGRIRVYLNPCVCLQPKEGLIFTLFPNDNK